MMLKLCRFGADHVRLALDQIEDLRRRSELAHIDLGEMTESSERVARPSAPGTVDGAGIAANALKFGLHPDDHLFGLQPGGGGDGGRMAASAAGGFAAGLRRDRRWRLCLARGSG